MIRLRFFLHRRLNLHEYVIILSYSAFYFKQKHSSNNNNRSEWW